MKIEKIQTELLKAAVKKITTSKNFTWNIAYDENENIVYITDGHMVMNIPGNQFVLDVDMIAKVSGRALINASTFKSFYKQESDAKAGVASNEMKKLDKITVAKIRTEHEDKFAWLDTKYLKYFDNISHFGVIDEKSPVFVYEDDQLVGVILPVKVR